MINQNVIDGLVWLYSIFDIKLLTVIATGFTIYFGYQKVTKKICVSYSISSGKLYDSHVTNFVISNKRDNSIIISSVNMKIGSKGSIELIKFEDPLVLKGYDAKLIDVPKYSDIYDQNGPVSIDVFERLSFSVITKSGEVIDCDVESSLTLKNFDNRLYKRVQIFNNIVLTSKMGFIFTYRINDKVNDVIIDKHGFISGSTPFKYNMFPDMSEEFFENFLISYGYHTVYDEYALFKVQDNLNIALVLNKPMVQNKINTQNR
ncbi:hypothetical protein OH773_19025 [Buttiauxella sp. WJP83]|uniref:hypothetical protein n=1 Tax=Buttiauxella sp. WJP83 TaxID=2986951 RepID=UPI0022DD5250|nr:hypothetical protein [Buttiauxella sp. WJP83]WBM70214.1 hypothetical protein OH773_19025 [Buttiauxella sp. WJP83]